MINIKTYFVVASLAIGAQVSAAPAVAVAGSAANGTQAVAIATADLAGSPEVAIPAAVPAAKIAVKPAEQAITEPSDWSMLLVGAGVLLLPRKRRVDNLVR